MARYRQRRVVYMAGSRRVLFLMGPASLLWRELGDAFEQAGHTTFKIHFSLGDQLFWWRRGGTAYRGRRSKFRAFLEAFIDRNAITDILYYADRDFYHIVAQEVAATRGITAISIENGYLRPDWITLERGGMGIYSRFPDDPDTIRAQGAAVPEPDLDVRYSHTFFKEITLEIAYSMITYFWRVFYPFYRFGRYYDPLLEYLAAIPHMLGKKQRQIAAQTVVEALEANEVTYFAVALQLQGDQQIRANSPFVHLSEFIDTVVGSFARHADASSQLVFKQHPHDNGREAWARVIAQSAVRHGVAKRVSFIDGGDLTLFLRKARGCVLVNSTVGLTALRLGCPTKVMGVAIYDIPGLTHQKPLDTFWRAPEPVDQALMSDFNRLLAASIQVKGSFVNPEGRKAAVTEIVRRVVSGAVNEPGACVEPPPRLKKAQELGIRV